MTPEERLALINETAQKILDMPDAERQAYQQQYWQAINDMLAEYNQIKASQKQQQMEAKNRGDALADMYRDANGNVIWVHNDWSQVILEAAPRKETPKKRQTPPKDREVKETIIEETTPIEVDVEKPELTWYKTEDPRYAKNNDNKWNGSWTWVWPWLVWWAGLWGLSYYWLYKNYGDKPKVLPPETVIPWRTPALWEVREGKLVSEWLLSDGKVTTQWPKWYLTDQVSNNLDNYKMTPDWQSLVDNSKATKVDPIKQRMAWQSVAEPVEWYHTPSTVKTETPKVIKTTAKKWAKKWTKKAVKEWLNKAAQKALKLVF